MHAVAVFPERKTVGLVRMREPGSPRQGRVLLRVLEVGLCGTDEELVTSGGGCAPEGSNHLVLGHESLAEIVELGPGVRDFSPGDLVVPLVRRPCPHPRCVACRAGRQDFCYTGDYTERGIRKSHGFLRERVEEEARWLVRVPPTLRRYGVFIEPLSIAEKALQQIHAIQQRLPGAVDEPDAAGRKRCALVLGAGAVGLLGAMMLTDQGYETTVYSREPEQSEAARAARSIGAYVCSRRVSLEDLRRRLETVDVVYEATGAAELAVRAISVLSPNAVFVLTGVPSGTSRIDVDVAKLLREIVLRNQVVFGTVNADRAAYETAVARLANLLIRWPEPLRFLKGHVHPLAEAPDLLTNDHPGIKHVVRIGA